MASSYVEVRESENGTEGGMLQFEIDPCESNGIDPSQHIEGEPPKDHTYNKEPMVVEGEIPESVSEDKQLEIMEEIDDDTVKKANKNPKNVKQRAGKSRTNEKLTKPSVKRDTSKRATTRKVKEEEEEEETIDGEIDVLTIESNVEISTDMKILETAVEASSLPKKRNHKRKAQDNPGDEMSTKQIKVSDEPAMAENPETSPKETVPEKKEEPAESKEKEVNQQKTRKPKEKAPPKLVKKVKARNMKKVKEATKLEVMGEKITKDVGEPDASLPPGWTRKLVERKSGKTAGLIDIYIYSPEGIKFRSRPDIAAYLARIKSSLRVEDFNFTKRGLTNTVAKPSAEKQKVPTKIREKLSPKVTHKLKKATHTGSNEKRGQKLVVKLSVSSPKKRAISNSATVSKARKKSKPEVSKTQTQKGTAISRRKK